MKLIHILINDEKKIGVQINEKEVILVEELLKENIPLTMIELIEKVELKDLEEGLTTNVKKINIDGVKILAPIEYPRKNVICLGKNYLDHALELDGKTTKEISGVPDHPIYFTKVAAPAVGHEAAIEMHKGVTEEVDYEVEMAVIIGKKVKNISKAEVEDAIFGYTVANDLTARDLQRIHVQWIRGKSLDTFCPLGPVIVTKDEIDYPPALTIESRVNGEVRQHSTTDNLIFDLDTIISQLSQGMTLYPGDIILTGTPSGVGMGFTPPKYLKSGDVVECEVEKIGVLRNKLK